MSNAVTKAKETALSTDVMDDIFDNAGDGATFESSEMQIPFVRVAQSLSPQLNKKKPEYIEGLSNGDAYNNLTNQMWSGETGLLVIPCFQTTKYLEFVPRESGGGFRGEISASDPILQRTNRVGSKEMLPSGNELVKADQHFCLIVDEEGMTQPVVIDMKSTQLKVSRRWKTNINMQKMKNPKTGEIIIPPVYATMWKLTTSEESNDKGDFYNWSVERVGIVEDRNLRLEAKNFRDSIMRGAVKAQSETSSGSQSRDESDIPF